MNNLTINIEQLSVSYDTKKVLEDINLQLEQGYIYGIVGPNGAGKSTLYKAILDLIPIDTGSILINKESIKLHRKDVVYIPQRGDIDWQFPATVLDIVLMGRYPYKKLFQRINKQDKALAIEALEAMGIKELKDRQIGELSGGQQQRVFLARALCQDASVLLLDEPFVGVDITTEERIVHILKKLANQGKTVLVIHHDLSKVDDYFDRIILLNKTIVAHGPTSTTFVPEYISKTYGGQLAILQQ